MIPTEEQEQMVVVQYLELLGLKFTAIPNSTYTKSWSQKNKNTRTGLRAGFPDLLIIVGDRVICIEMKRKKGGTLSPEQKQWNLALNAAGVPAYVCRGAEEAIKVIDNHIIVRPSPGQKSGPEPVIGDLF